MVYTNSIAPAKWCKTDDVKHNNTTNHRITEGIHQRQRDEYDKGELQVCREPLLGCSNIIARGDEHEVPVADTDNN